MLADRPSSGSRVGMSADGIPRPGGGRPGQPEMEKMAMRNHAAGVTFTCDGGRDRVGKGVKGRGI